MLLYFREVIQINWPSFSLTFNQFFSIILALYQPITQWSKSLFSKIFNLKFQVGVSRSPPLKESDSVLNSSPEHEGKETEADLLVSHNRVNQSTGFSGKLKKFLRRLCGNLQFKNVQVSLFVSSESRILISWKTR